uniref:HIT domain-containing protein n=1 Tax=Acrobeloides nanus TaxID=290746 RepID=A0A914DZI3_9BILA
MFLFKEKKQASQCQNENCVFCKIVKKRCGRIIYEDNDVLAFYNIHPQAPVHFLVIPKKHIDMVQNVTTKDSKLLGKLMYVGTMIAKNIPELKNGYRLLMNNGENARQEVYHIHLQVVGGTKLIYPKHIKNQPKRSSTTSSLSE